MEIKYNLLIKNMIWKVISLSTKVNIIIDL